MGVAILAAEFVRAIVELCECQFPKRCSTCTLTFATYREFVEKTTHTGAPSQLDVSEDDPIGIVAYASCRCGTTLTVRWEGEPGEARVTLRSAIAHDAKMAKTSEEMVLAELQALVRAEVTTP